VRRVWGGSVTARVADPCRDDEKRAKPHDVLNQIKSNKIEKPVQLCGNDFDETEDAAPLAESGFEDLTVHSACQFQSE
jgi:hypothetical protein